MSRGLTILGVAVLALAGVACDANGPTNVATDWKHPPYTQGIVVGRTYNYSLGTHCGIRQTAIDGSNWRASPPLGDKDGNPPEAWTRVPTIGRLKIVSKNRAIFSVENLSATFVRDDLPGISCA